jgi:hypothetical protein
MEKPHLKKRERWLEMSTSDLIKLHKHKQMSGRVSKSAKNDAKLLFNIISKRKQAELLINPPISKKPNFN